jgi:hypothetical protein
VLSECDSSGAAGCVLKVYRRAVEATWGTVRIHVYLPMTHMYDDHSQCFLLIVSIKQLFILLHLLIILLL